MHSQSKLKEAQRQANIAATEAFLRAGGKITKLGRSKRAFSGTEIKLLERGETTALNNYRNERADIVADREARRAQRG